MPVDYLADLDAEGWRLIEAVTGVDLDTAVPGLDWDVRTVAVHTGAVHRWSADIIRRRLPTNETGGSWAFWPADLADASLVVWLAEGLEALIETLTAAPAGLDCFTFIPGLGARTFWRRRQAHETAVHRMDVECALGGSTAVDSVSAEFAQDGLAEIVGAFAVEPGFAVDRSGRLLLDATDGDAWLVVFGGRPTTVLSGPSARRAACDASVCGTSSDLYRWAWNRPVTEVQFTGDTSVRELWRQIQVQ